VDYAIRSDIADAGSQFSGIVAVALPLIKRQGCRRVSVEESEVMSCVLKAPRQFKPYKTRPPDNQDIHHVASLQFPTVSRSLSGCESLMPSSPNIIVTSPKRQVEKIVAPTAESRSITVMSGLPYRLLGNSPPIAAMVGLMNNSSSMPFLVLGVIRDEHLASTSLKHGHHRVVVCVRRAAARQINDFTLVLPD
jgi:hypothetical protein